MRARRKLRTLLAGIGALAAAALGGWACVTEGDVLGLRPEGSDAASTMDGAADANDASDASDAAADALDAPDADASLVVDPNAVTQIAFGDWTSCFLRGGHAFCAGFNGLADFGNASHDVYDVEAGSRPLHLSPEAAAMGLSFASLALGSEAHCGLVPDGTAYCWGPNDYDQVGTSNATCAPLGSPTPCQTVPVAKFAGTKFKTISAGRYVTCAVAIGGDLWCWGGRFPKTTTAQVYPGPYAAVSVSGSGGGACDYGGGSPNPICALSAAGHAFCWGDCNTYGQLGTGGDPVDASAYQPSPAVVLGGHTFKTISSSDDGACAVDTSGTGYCWGVFYDDGASQPRSITVPAVLPLPAGKAFADIRGGSNAACGLTTSGEVYCWGGVGINGRGLLGNGVPDPAARPTPTLVPGLPPMRSIAFGAGAACAISMSGVRWCWGRNQTDNEGSPHAGQLGDGMDVDVTRPEMLP